ncbi:uncharacterized protein LOC135479667 isoform X2 [Liolophura sinensis]|uniref:uncharacterized protein LOC135479667 isoform X2 n=1 Tax=Liolophura sinensis TaxID=3198878 RepID=UPI00315955AE
MTDWTEDIKERNALFTQYFRSRDFPAISRMYTEDCHLMPSGEKAMDGHKAVLDIFSKLPGLGVDSVTLTTKEVIPMNDTAIERGDLVLVDSSSTIVDTGKYVVIWKRIQGEPMLYIDIWNSDSQK